MYLATKGNIAMIVLRGLLIYTRKLAGEQRNWWPGICWWNLAFHPSFFSMISDQIDRVRLAENLKLVETRYLKTHERNSSYIYMYKTDTRTWIGWFRSGTLHTAILKKSISKSSWVERIKFEKSKMEKKLIFEKRVRTLWGSDSNNILLEYGD